MSAQTIGIAFEGYWRDENEAGIPAMSGVFCVYTCVDHADAHAVELNELLYIGAADDVQARIAAHEMLPEWKRHVRPGEDLCYSFGHVAAGDLARCEAALVYHNRPPLNTEFKGTFDFDRTTISLSGQHAHLQANFTVQRTQ